MSSPRLNQHLLGDQIPLNRRVFRIVAAATCLTLLAACATPQPARRPQDVVAERSLRKGRSVHLSLDARAADYLQAAALTAPELGSGKQATSARDIYNAAAAVICCDLFKVRLVPRAIDAIYVREASRCMQSARYIPIPFEPFLQMGSRFPMM